MKELNLKFVAIFYFVLFVVAQVWSYLRGDSSLWVHPKWEGMIEPEQIVVALLIGICTAVFVIVLSQLGSVYFEWARKLEKLFGNILGELKLYEIIAIAVLSGVGEEAFFRGAMQPTLGIWFTTLVFGLLHIGPEKAYIPWTISAFAIGGVFGYYFEATGSLVAPVVAHTLINFVNLYFIQKKMKDEGRQQTS